MLYQKKGDTVLDSGKVFTVGGEVFANHACDYEGECPPCRRHRRRKPRRRHDGLRGRKFQGNAA